MLEAIDHGEVRELRLARPPVNALNGALLARLAAAVDAAERDGCRGLVLSGAPGHYTAGLDVVELLTLDRAAMTAFWATFIGCLKTLARARLPIVAAVTGHSPAGGAVLALYCDRRVMAAGDYRIGLNEVQVGLYPGHVIHRVFQRVVGTRVAAEFLATGALVSGARALEVGFVDELAPPDAVVERARAWLGHVLALPPAAYARTRALVRADLVAIMDEVGEREYAAMNEAWFSAETQATVRALVAKLAARR
jgi:enoyl-CoA hydratase/carnithine racemase